MRPTPVFGGESAEVARVNNSKLVPAKKPAISRRESTARGCTG
jgi:hypothetical protein